MLIFVPIFLFFPVWLAVWWFAFNIGKMLHLRNVEAYSLISSLFVALGLAREIQKLLT
jgi:hypothetical protein